MATVDDPDMEMDSEEELEEEVDGSGESQMEVEEENRIRWVPVARPVDRPYGRPRLDELPPTVLYRIVRHMIGDIGATLAFRMVRHIDLIRATTKPVKQTCKALKKIVAETPDLWWKHAQYLRGRTQMLFAPDPVVLPGHLVPAFQEELLRCAFILNYKWTNPAFRALSVNRKAGSQWSPHGVEQASFFSILFVPDSAGRYFLTVSRVDVHLWTLEPNSLPRMCRRIFPRANALLGEKESIVNALVSRPQGPIPGSPKSMVSYLAIQYTLKDSSRLRTEIYQLHLSPPGADLGPGFGLCGIHMTEGSLVAFTDFVLAYALGDAAQTILLCCWVTRQATRLVTPVREWEVRWQHQSCRAVTIGLDIIIVVRDSTAEVYPRAGFTLLEESEWPRRILYTPIEGDLEYLPTIYATDIAVFPCNFTKTPKIHIHQPRAAASVSEGVAIELCVQPISLIGVARSSVPLSEPHVPYYVETAKLFKTYTPWPTPRSNTQRVCHAFAFAHRAAFALAYGFLSSNDAASRA
ncbi:hypothetical protein FRC12_011000 [Ceratobasidium sp. 428]|nr:hypothetical protein FRC12_011000 [Ceratobasidium sp. 428]